MGLIFKQTAPVLVPILVEIGIIGSTAIGTIALITGNQNFKTLRRQINLDFNVRDKIQSVKLMV